jgi:glutathione synthase/RimK-type ligase-like ATP-grasp enzyme
MRSLDESMSYRELLNMNLEELEHEFQKYLEEAKQDYKVVALMGSLGVSPKYMSMYFNSVNELRNLK